MPPSRSDKASRWLSLSLPVAGVASLVLSSCAPLTTMPPPVPFIEGAQNEMGLAAGLAALGYIGPTTDWQLWYRRELKNELNLGIVASSLSQEFSIELDAASAGFSLQGTREQRDRVTIGWKIGGGWIWGRVGSPITVQVRERMWLYTEPSLGLSARGLAHLPVGMSLPLGKRGQLNAETGVHASALSWGGTPSATLRSSILATTRTSASACRVSFSERGSCGTLMMRLASATSCCRPVSHRPNPLSLIHHDQPG